MDQRLKITLLLYAEVVIRSTAGIQSCEKQFNQGEIIATRYAKKRLEFAWSPDLLVPLLDSYENTIPSEGKTTLGTTVREEWPRFKFLGQENN